MDLTIFIPSCGRASVAKQVTLREILTFSRLNAVLVVPPDELADYQQVASMIDPDRFKVIACEQDGIGPTRQWIIENSPTRGVFMMDDDMYFSYRPDPADPYLEKCTDLVPMVDAVIEALDGGFPHGGVSARQGNNHIENGYKDLTRVNNIHFFDRDVFLEEGVRFDAIPVMEDFYVTLSLLSRGIPNRVLYEWAWNQQGSGNEGGCSTYRTAEVQAESAHKLKELFPNFVKVTEKESKSGKGIFAGVRTDVIIQWRKAWQSAEHLRKTTRPLAEPDMESYSAQS
jgi:hypothetical protein